MAKRKTTPTNTKSPLCGVGGVVLRTEPIEYNSHRPTATIEVRNTGDRPIQVGSHFHFFEANRYLDFDRTKAFGMHLNIPATTAIRFEPGQSRQVELVGFGGRSRIIGFGGLTEGSTEPQTPHDGYEPSLDKALRRATKRGYKHSTKNTKDNHGNNR